MKVCTKCPAIRAYFIPHDYQWCPYDGSKLMDLQRQEGERMKGGELETELLKGAPKVRQVVDHSHPGEEIQVDDKPAESFRALIHHHSEGYLTLVNPPPNVPMFLRGMVGKPAVKIEWGGFHVEVHGLSSGINIGGDRRTTFRFNLKTWKDV